MSKRKDRERANATGMVMRGGKLVPIKDVEEEKRLMIGEGNLARAEFQKSMTIIDGQLFGIRPRPRRNPEGDPRRLPD